MTTSSSLAAEQQEDRARRFRRTPVLAWGALAALLLVMILAVGVDGGTVTWEQTLRSLAWHLGMPVEPLSPLTDSIVWELRLPRVISAAVAGASLACCGCVLQAVTRNALADPYLLGISAGASTGAVLVLVLGFGAGAVTLAGGALIGGLAAFALVFLLLGRSSSTSATRLVLTGVVVGQLFAALTSLVLMVWGDADSTRGLMYWLLGSLAAARWSSTVLCLVVAVSVLAVMRFLAGDLDAFAFGTDTAAALGVNVGRTRVIALTAAAMATAVTVSAVGAVGFVGLIVPHAARMLVGSTHRVLLPASAIGGAVFLTLADLAGRVTFSPQQIPVGVVTALVGVPMFLVILRRREGT